MYASIREIMKRSSRDSPLRRKKLGYKKNVKQLGKLFIKISISRFILFHSIDKFPVYLECIIHRSSFGPKKNKAELL